MNLINAKYEILPQEPGLEGIYKQIEIPGRICYGSLDKIAPGTAEPFCENVLMAANHGAPLEHNGVYLHLHADSTNCFKKFEYPSCGFTANYNWNDVIGRINARYSQNAYSKTVSMFDGNNRDVYISTNLRVLFENGWMDDLQWLCEPTKFHEQRITVKFTVDRFTGEEFLRHRKASFNRESTRYVNFTKEKFGNGDITFIKPCWVENDITPLTDEGFRNLCHLIYTGEDTDDFTDIEYWLFALKSAEYSYNNLIRLGWRPEQARTVLNCAINSPLIKTAFVSDWVHFFNLRAIGTTGRPHPQAKELAEPLMYEFINMGLIEFIDNPNEKSNIKQIVAKK